VKPAAVVLNETASKTAGKTARKTAARGRTG
jgi:hypothetical protein